jgi:hypothetical protein
MPAVNTERQVPAAGGGQVVCVAVVAVPAGDQHVAGVEEGIVGQRPGDVGEELGQPA